MSKKFYAGIDIGGTTVKCGIVDSEGKIIVKESIPTGEADCGRMATDIAELVKKLERAAGVKTEGAGIGAPGLIDSKNGVIVYSPNIVWKNVPICAELEKRLCVPVKIANDANAAALGEAKAGSGKNYGDVVFVTLGTGVGGGIIIGGKLFEGFRSAGAEIGHHVIRFNGEQCTCGRKGCFEAYASATALIRQTKVAMENDRDSKLWEICPNLDDVCGKTVFEGVEANDRTAEEVLDAYISYLAEGIVNIVNILRPEAVLIGGGVSAAGDVLLDPLREKVNKLVFGGTAYAPVKIYKATLGNDAGLIGAACLVMD